MAEKGFGVKEVNLIGASGTPTITSPNNLNLNANNVAISTNVSIGGTLSVTGNVSVGGTLTYEDVTNIDSVGIVTARTGVVTPNLDVDDFISVGSNIHLGNAGVVTATTFSGSAASLTSIPAANITGTLPAISGANLTGITITPTNSDIQVVYTVTANGTSAYRFAGNGVVSTADDPDLYLIRGQKYRFINNSGGSHPFQIREASGGTAYSTGVTNNGASSGNIDFAPTYDSPAQLVYQCTSHGGMVGNIYLRDAAGNNTNVGVTTFAGHVQANNIKLDRGSATDVALRIDTTSSTGACRIRFLESGNDKADLAYSHDNNQIELIGRSGQSAAIITDGNKTGFKVDTNGYVTKPLNAAFSAYMANTYSWNNQTIVYDSKLFDYGSNYSTSTGEFTAPITGLYVFGVKFRANGGFSQFGGMFERNGSTYKRAFGQNSYAGGDCITAMDIIPMTAGQTMRLRFEGSHGGATGGSQESGFWGYLLQ